MIKIVSAATVIVIDVQGPERLDEIIVDLLLLAGDLVLPWSSEPRRAANDEKS
ncbi:MAG TPA: hypothetical protein VGD45_28280 [Steroidobacter sp.]|uniref:hypothetical protein n=1 Tax=Steroidobacter sp. TaxID=1978227 RepID=UPI002ED78D2B